MTSLFAGSHLINQLGRWQWFSDDIQIQTTYYTYYTYFTYYTYYTFHTLYIYITIYIYYSILYIYYIYYYIYKCDYIYIYSCIPHNPQLTKLFASTLAIEQRGLTIDDVPNFKGPLMGNIQVLKPPLSSSKPKLIQLCLLVYKYTNIH